jgi:DNA helicase-4
LAKPVYDSYQSHLAARGQIDFNDMINKASAYIVQQKYQRKLSYIIIDEFQDISLGRYQMVKAIKSLNPECKLFCVGDDWQSIYRFAGSDISLFTEFEKYFGFTASSKIETTYRFCDPLIKLSGNFILKNPAQAKKRLKSLSKEKETNYKIVYSGDDEMTDAMALKEIFDQLIDEGRYEKEILILGRYTFDVKRLEDFNNTFSIFGGQDETIVRYEKVSEGGTASTVNARYMTVHKSKGLEADIVIVINCNSGQFGFPAEMSDDPVLNLLLSEADQYPNGEERRLFYVAMTRAKEQLYLVADRVIKSKFITEFESSDTAFWGEKCPSCKTADVVLRKEGISRIGDRYKFFGCSNYLYGCEFNRVEFGAH